MGEKGGREGVIEGREDGGKNGWRETCRQT